MARSKTWTESEIREAVARGDSLSDVARSLGLQVPGGIRTINRHITKLGLCTKHFTREAQRRLCNDDKVFRVGSCASGNSKKEAILRRGLKDYCCAVCGNKGEHNSKPLVLQLDHINGNRKDNRLENLRFLCPNCHSQTPTFAGRNKRAKPCKVHPKKRRGGSCKINWPENEALSALVWNKTMVTIARELGVSDRSVAKHCKKHGIQVPPSGYWLRK